jgi:hypothetical protein
MPTPITAAAQRFWVWVRQGGAACGSPERFQVGRDTNWFPELRDWFAQ